MYWQRRYILRTTTLAVRDATWRYPLPSSNILSALFLKVSMTNGATSNVDHDILSDINRIRIVANGSEILYSLRPEEIFSREWFVEGKRMSVYRSQAGGDVQWAVFPIRFGRFPRDPNFWLNLSRYTSLDLEVDLSFDDVAADGWADVYPTVELIACMAMEGTPGARTGYIRSTEFDTYTSEASGEQPFDVPQYNAVPYIYVYAREDGVEDGVDITDVEVRLNNGERIPFTANWLDLQDENKVMFDIDPRLKMTAFIADSDVISVRMTRIQAMALETMQTLDFAEDTWLLDKTAAVAGNQLTFSCGTADITAGGAALLVNNVEHECLLKVMGAAAPHAVVIPFAIPDNLSGALDTAAWDEVEVVLTNGGAGATVYLFFDEIVTR